MQIRNTADSVIIMTIPHLLLTCCITKKLQIKRHDEICKEIYKALLLKIRENEQEIVNPVKCYIHEEKQITIKYYEKENCIICDRSNDVIGCTRTV